ncbi:substrate-binding domain-containing protein [Streptomyces sp. NPDC002928]|uniref:sugar ABC transporter substrate-binding protein n=1 Tax=Streptomyces sp. NPDC002928 TaxID=3154440 RepID=UPI0033A92BAC
MKNAAAVKAADAILDEARAPIQWQAPGPAFDATKASGKKLLYIANNLQLPFSKALADALKQALTPLGVKVSVIDAQGNVDEVSKAIQSGIGQKVDAIALQTYPADLISAPLKAAKAAGIQVVASFNRGDPGFPTEKERKELGIVADVDYCQSCVGEVMGAWAVSHTGGDAHVVAYGVLNDPGSTLQQAAERKTIEKLCKGCSFSKFTYQNFNDFFNQLTTQAASDILDGKVNVLMPDYDTFSQPILPAISQKGADSRVSVIGFNGTPSVLNGIFGKGPLRADVGTPYTWPAWAMADQALRALSGEPTVESENIGFRLFDSTNMSGIDFKAGDEQVYGVDPAVEYPKLWHTS